MMAQDSGKGEVFVWEERKCRWEERANGCNTVRMIISLYKRNSVGMVVVQSVSSH